MKNYLLKILFSSVTYNYETDLDANSILEIISKKTVKKTTLLSHNPYSLIIDNNSSNFVLIVRGRAFPIKVMANISEQDHGNKVSLEFKSLISPLFFLAPSVLFLCPLFLRDVVINDQIPNAFEKLGFSFTAVLLFAILMIAFTHDPIRKEKGKLEAELHLKQE